MPDYSNLSVLIVDPNQSMRASVHNMLTQVNITKVDHAVSAATAIRALSTRSYDVILCEYDLGTSADGAGQDGQQLLEDLRHHKVISPWSIFVMLTSEGVYGKVVSAAELLPTDYILKPFTVDVLSQRIGRALERRAKFLPVYQLIGQGRAREAIEACLANEAAQARYAIDYARLRAELLASLERHAEAEEAYTGILKLKPLGWAQLGQARAVYGLGRLADAERCCASCWRKIPSSWPPTTCWPSCCASRTATPTPSKCWKMRWHCRRTWCAGCATSATWRWPPATSPAPKRPTNRWSPRPSIPSSATRPTTSTWCALVTKGDAAGAASVVRDLERSMRASPSVEVCRGYAASMVKQLNGDADGAAAELAKAMDKLAEATGMSSNLKLGLAHACLANRMDEQANALFDQLIANPNSGVDAEQVAELCRQAGRQDIVKRYILSRSSRWTRRCAKRPPSAAPATCAARWRSCRTPCSAIPATPTCGRSA
jgi:DNA-binding response OmpR family regulator